jgi:hypothetical protein
MSVYDRYKGSGTGEAITPGTDHWDWPQGDQIRQILNALASQGAKGGFLGGSRTERVQSATAVDVPQYWDVLVDWRHLKTSGATNPLTVQARVDVWTDDAATSVVARIANITDGANYDYPTPYSTATTWGEQLITIPQPGALAIKRYRLQLIGGNATSGIMGIGAIEVFDDLY